MKWILLFQLCLASCASATRPIKVNYYQDGVVDIEVPAEQVFAHCPPPGIPAKPLTMPVVYVLYKDRVDRFLNRQLYAPQFCERDLKDYAKVLRTKGWVRVTGYFRHNGNPDPMAAKLTGNVTLKAATNSWTLARIMSDTGCVTTLRDCEDPRFWEREFYNSPDANIGLVRPDQ